MQRMKHLVVAVSQHTVLLAESAIAGCISCTKSAYVPFARILDMLGNHPVGCVDYILPVLAVCPKCQSLIDECVLVVPKQYRPPIQRSSA